MNCLDFWAVYCMCHIQHNQTMISPSLQQERARLLEKMAHIDRMVRDHVSQQTYQVQRGERTVTQGPYHLLQRRENGRNNCQRVGADELDFIVQAVERHDRFQTLAQRYAAIACHSLPGGCLKK